ncbi:DNA repair protein RadC [Kangiella sp. HZ709]|uniref:RadC family protein n=1 Tax=Kangiella sp. HZ709 TaxID=2666328 RepID=UPI0012AFD585|nr:DNA repair protein RadC [Kangiella sp. HZ709]MRX27624.1 DNA repair protein RadC [Kangiella sp. HZ709]
MRIMEWPSSERPRERLLTQGAANLSDAELLAIFLRTGTKKLNVVDLARYLLHDFRGIKPLLEADFKTFNSYPGLGSAKFCQLQACLELSKRYLEQSFELEQAFTNPGQVQLYLKSLLSNKQREHFYLLLLNNQNQLIRSKLLFKGTINSAEVHPRIVVESALNNHASAVIFAHNHPSGVASPSDSDISLTQQLKKALKLVDIRTLDHIIVAHSKTYSFAEHGLI